MKEGGDGFVRADQIDLKSLDEQLERHLNRAWTMEEERGGGGGGRVERRREEWEIDPSKLVIKGAIARGTFGAVHRSVYDGRDVAGETMTRVKIQSLATMSTQSFFRFLVPIRSIISILGSAITSPLTDQEQLLEKLQVFKIQGRDKRGRRILRIVGKFFPGSNTQPRFLIVFLESLEGAGEAEGVGEAGEAEVDGPAGLEHHSAPIADVGRGGGRTGRRGRARASPL